MAACSAKFSALGVGALVLLGFLFGCVAPQYTPSFRVDFRSLDTAPLQGRRIVIDPGHGGRFTGAVGTKGLRESDINLAVGLHLWGLLAQAGAEVWLTRSADVDLCPSSEAVLSEDLTARVAFSNDHHAELFVSIHHNSNTYNRGKNNTQVYYKLTDPGPSQDVARAVAEELGKGQGLGQILVLPGNYRVLRGVEALAILGEASFISHAKNETRLSLANQLRREAEDYFLGILAYFHKGIPEVASLEPKEATIENAFPTISATIKGVERGGGIDPTTVAVFVDEQPVPCWFERETGTISCTPQGPLASGPHALRVEARNRNGNAAWSKPTTFSVSLPPATSSISLEFSCLPADGKSFTRGQVAVLDRYGTPVIDGTKVFLRVSGGKLDHEELILRSGCGHFYFTAPLTPGEASIEAYCQGVRSEATIACGALDKALLRLFVKDSEQKPIASVQVLAGDIPLGISDENGLIFLHSDRSEQSLLTFARAGYEAKQERVDFEKGAYRVAELSMVAKEGGLLLNRRVVLDPEPYDEQTAQEHGLTAQAEAANLAVVRYLQTLLTQAGAQTFMTFGAQEARPTPADRVRFAEKFPAEFFLTITHRKGAPRVFHYYSSETGKRLAAEIARSLGHALKTSAVEVCEGLDFTVIHTAVPAIIVDLGGPSLGKKRGMESTRREEEAKSIYRGLVEFFRNKRC